MGALQRPEYESWETEGTLGVRYVTETSENAIDHNRPMDLISGKSGAVDKAASGKLPPEQVEGIEPATTMQNDILTQPNSDSQGVAALTGHELDAFLGKAFEDKPIWTGLWESI